MPRPLLLIIYTAAAVLVVLVARQILETKIISGSLGLHPLTTLISMYAGLWTLRQLSCSPGQSETCDVRNVGADLSAQSLAG